MPGQWIWDFWAPHYNGLWAQYFVLSRCRALVRQRMAETTPDFSRLLDAGCGVGELLSELSDIYPKSEFHGFDPSERMIAEAQDKHPGERIHHRVGTLDDQKEGAFDVITMCNAFPYVEDHFKGARHIRELLKPGGRVFIVQANTEGLWDKLGLAIVKTTTSRAIYHSAAQLEDIFSAAGFQADGVRRVDTWRILPSIQLCEFVLEN